MTTALFDLNAGAIIRMGYTMAGIVSPGDEPDSNQYSFGRDILNTRMTALQNEGLILRTVTQQAFPLVAGTAKYALPASTLDIDTGKPYVTNGTINVPLEWWSRDQYMSLTQPSTQSQPTSIYIEKTATINFYLYPVPDNTWTTITLPVVSLIADITLATDTTGLQSKYLSTFITGVASWIALSHGLLPRYSALDKEFQREKNLSTNDDTERGSLTFVADYGSSNYGRRVL